MTLPSEKEQKEVGEYLEHLDNLITLHQRKCRELQELKNYASKYVCVDIRAEGCYETIL